MFTSMREPIDPNTSNHKTFTNALTCENSGYRRSIPSTNFFSVFGITSAASNTRYKANTKKPHKLADDFCSTNSVLSKPNTNM